jgi:hypothetical protein
MQHHLRRCRSSSSRLTKCHVLPPRLRPSPPTSSSMSFSPSRRKTTTTTTHHRSKRPPLPQSFDYDPLLVGKRILIANRGEISMRIADAARSLGMTSISVCAPEDANSPHVEYADECVILEGGSTPIGPYLDVDGLTTACLDERVDYVHPGELCTIIVRLLYHRACDVYMPFFFFRKQMEIKPSWNNIISRAQTKFTTTRIRLPIRIGAVRIVPTK